jgi:hypothetical protein
MPASRTDIDHSTLFRHDDPAAGGLTVESGLGCLCRGHHRLKTHADHGRNGWRVRMLDGRRVEWTAPCGETRVTEPEGREYLFPATASDNWISPMPPPPPVRHTVSRLETLLSKYRTPAHKYPQDPSMVEFDLEESLEWARVRPLPRQPADCPNPHEVPVGHRRIRILLDAFDDEPPS